MLNVNAIVITLILAVVGLMGVISTCLYLASRNDNKEFKSKA